MADQTIICPTCGTPIPISKALTEQIEADLRASFEAEEAKRRKAQQLQFEQRLATEAAKVAQQVRKEAEQAAAKDLARIRSQLVEAQQREKSAQASFEDRLKQERARLQKQARETAQAERAEEIATLQAQLKQKAKQVADVQRQMADLEKLKDQLALREKKLELEVARKVKDASRKATEQARATVEEEYRTRQLVLEKQLGDAKRQAAELKRKLEQSSEQTQGEVIELELEKMLARAFPDDEFEPIGKGRAGADVLQRIYTPNGQYCGAILWESKNTQNWTKGWLAKLRSDQRRAKAELAVLVSTALPKDVRHFAAVDGVWVTEFGLAPGLAAALRANVMQVGLLKQSSNGKHEKMELLYQYLSSTEFRQRIEAIVESFRSMQDDLDKERQTMERQWAKREKQIQLVVQNVAGMYGDMQGIAGQSLPKIRRLELPASSHA